MKNTLTFVLFILCVLTTIMILNVNDYAQLFGASISNECEEQVNNKLENKDNCSLNHDQSIENELEDYTIVHKNTLEESQFSFLKSIIDNGMKFMVDVNNSEVDYSFIKRKSILYPWYDVIYNKDFSLCIDEQNNTFKWLEINNKDSIFGLELANYKEIEEKFPNGSIEKVRNEEFNYDYYQLVYKYDDINIKFISFYEDGTNNICIIG